MAGYTHTFYISQATYGGTTYSCVAGGAPMSFSFSMGGTPAGERVAGNSYASNQSVLDPTGECTLNLAGVLPSGIPDLGDQDTLVLTLVENQHTGTQTITLYRMVFTGLQSQQGRASAGGIQLGFAYESTCTGIDMFTAA